MKPRLLLHVLTEMTSAASRHFGCSVTWNTTWIRHEYTFSWTVIREFKPWTVIREFRRADRAA